MGQWVKYFLTGIIQTSERASKTLHDVIELKTVLEKDKIEKLGRRTRHGLILLREIFTNPMVTIKHVQQITGLTPKSANALVNVFIDQGILEEVT